MLVSYSGAGALGALENLLLEIAQERELEALLPLIVRRLAETTPDVALARIWLSGPGDCCAVCPNAPACASREACLHLVASAERPREGALSLHVRPDSSFGRIPIGAFKVGKVFERRETVVVHDAALDPGISRRDWVAAERIRSFAGQPLLYRGQVLGVLGVFLRVELPRSTADVLRLLANHAAAAIAGARAYDEITRLQQRLQRENEHLRRVASSRGIIREEEVRRFERDNLLAAVASTGGRIYGRGGAAELLGIKPTTLASRLKKLGGR